MDDTMNENLEVTVKKPDLNEVAKFYHNRLNPETRAILNSRGISDQTIEKYLLGFDDGSRLGFVSSEMSALGDYFKDRFIFPIMDAKGNVVNMVGRSHIDAQPLYKNLPLNYVVNPDILFNETVISQSDSVFLCEGIVDAISLIQANFPAVAILGVNSFKPEWAEKFKGKHVFLCFDNDEVGRMGKEAIARQISEAAQEVYFINLPQGIKDINDFFVRVQEPAKNFSLLVYQSVEVGKYRQFPADVRNLNTFHQEYVRRHEGKMVGISTGFARLDKTLFGGFRDGLYILTGEPGSGKSTLLKNLADRIAGMKIPVIHVSLETSAFELWAKSMSRLTGSKMADVLCGRVDIKAIEEANKAYVDIAAFTWTVEGMGPVPVNIIDSYVYQTVNELGTVPVVIIDYLQRIPVDIQIQPATQEIFDSYNAFSLKRLSQKYACAVIVASSLEKLYTGGKDTNDRITGVFYTADVVMNLAAPKTKETNNGDEPPTPVKLEILKNRNGILREIPLLFHKNKSYFESAPQPDDDK